MITQYESTILPTKYCTFTAIPFVDENNINNNDALTDSCNIALVLGDVAHKNNVLVRLHSECLTGDVFGSQRCDCGQQLNAAMKKIADEGCGVILYLRQEGRGIGLLSKLKAYALQDKGLDTVEANHELGFKDDERDFTFAVEILKRLGIASVRLMTNNPQKLEALRKIIPAERVELKMMPGEHNHSYLSVKKEKLGHLL